MENEIRELLKEQRLRVTQEDERRKLEDLRLLEIQEALKKRDEEAAQIEKEFEEAKRKRFLALKRLDEERLRDLKELELIENNRKAAEAQRQKEVLGAVDVLNGFLQDEQESVKPPDHILRALKDLSEFLESDRRKQ